MVMDVVDESLSSFKPMYCSREYQASTRLSQQYEKSTSNEYLCLYLGRCCCLFVVADVNTTYIDLIRCVNG